ncbi:MAG: metal ABC transporter permease [Fretibacterium sp.]|nr:metal ABC transporter permease [Fretibacterium sp.]
MTAAEIFELLSYPFVARALLVGLMVSLCASMLGVILVLKRYSMIGHGLAEVGFAALSVALAFDLPALYVSAPIVVAASFAIMFVSQRRKVDGDVAIGIASSAALAFGVIVTAMTRGMNLDVCGYMFGSILAMTNEDVVLSVVLSCFVTGAFVLFYNRLFLVTYNEDYARSLGINVTGCQFLISFLTALTVVLGMRMMGTLLISSLIILPAVTARRLVSSFRALVVLAACLSLLCFTVGLAASFLWNLPTGASVVCVNVAALLASGLLARLRR